MLAGCFLGPKNLLGDYWRLLGNQGWEFVELGKLWQVVLFVALIMWAVIIYRGVKPALKGQSAFSLPYWILYSVVAITILFLSSFVGGKNTNFVIADFWRWCVIHMWAECFFEVFTTIVIACYMVFMGLVSRQGATRVIYLATLLFLGSGLLGISHNFYWNAKPAALMAMGSVFSTLQVIPLVLLTLEVWKFVRVPGYSLRRSANSCRNRIILRILRGLSFPHCRKFLELFRRRCIWFDYKPSYNKLLRTWHLSNCQSWSRRINGCLR